MLISFLPLLLGANFSDRRPTLMVWYCYHINFVTGESIGSEHVFATVSKFASNGCHTNFSLEFEIFDSEKKN